MFVASAISVIVSVVLFVVAAITVWWTMHAWRTPETLAGTRFGSADGTQSLSFSLLLPARHEQQVLEHTVRRLMQSTHRNFEIIIIIGHDDPETGAVANRLARRYPERVRVVIDTNPVKNKPRALNTALPYCRGLVVGVFDAEDQVHPSLLDHVDHAFRATGADVVQGGVQLINFQSSWYSLQNCLEYFFWFRSRLHLHARRGFIPLGGNTVFVRTAALRAVGSWDGNCLAEDCDLGVRLSSRGAKVVVAYDSALVTREETPTTLRALVKQRTRWNQGFLQVLLKGDWRRLPTFWQRMLARYTLTGPFLQAFAGIAVPLGILIALFFEVSLGAALVSFVPLAPLTANLFFQVVGLRDFGRQYKLRIRPVHYLKLILGTFPYTLVLGVAAIRAVWRVFRGRNDWELTPHVGAHLTGVAPAAGAGPTPVARTGMAPVGRARPGNRV